MRLGDVQALVRELADHGLRTWIFGGWADEVHGLSPPRPHKDLDLLYPAPDFAALDAFISASRVREYAVKHSACSRAFDHHGEFVEFYLVQSDARGWFTDFWGYMHGWPVGTFEDTSE